MNVEAALAVERLVRPAESEVEVEDRLDVGVEAIVPLAGERPVAALEIADGAGVAIEVAFGDDAAARRPLAVVLLIVVAGDQPLVVGRHDAAAQIDRLATAPRSGHGIGLAQVLVGIERLLARQAAVGPALDRPEERLEHGIAVGEGGLKAERVGEGLAAPCHVVVERDMDVVPNVVVEAVDVGPDARLLERVDRERRGQIARALRVLADEGVDVGRVGWVVERDQGRIHVARCQRRPPDEQR